MMSSHLLGREQMTANVTKSQVTSYLQRIMTSQSSEGGGYMIIGMQGGLGLENMRGALNPDWRRA